MQNDRTMDVSTRTRAGEGAAGRSKRPVHIFTFYNGIRGIHGNSIGYATVVEKNHIDWKLHKKGVDAITRVNEQALIFFEIFFAQEAYPAS
jgi:hypothetical protein